ncbi:MAG: radical SAM family RiPP maturation amino acid epimerase [Planctomycetota bacterium]
MSVAHIKRFQERWDADDRFRAAVAQDPQAAVEYYGICIDPHAVRPLWDKELAHLKEDEQARHRQFPLLKEYDEYIRSLTRRDILSRVDASTNPGYRAWRRRQVARTAAQFPKAHQDRLIHLGLVLELTKGCSVGCWFCGLAAPRLQGVFAYTRRNAALWRKTLEAMRDTLGPAAGSGICYWATEPFDNPDYESFCADFADILGVFPQTTTARPLADPARTRAMMRLSLEKGCTHNRFSVTSLRMLDRLHKEFSAEELRHVLLLVYSKTSDRGIAVSGRATAQRSRPLRKDYKFSTEATIACASGFLINMVERTVELITPCVVSRRWPLGYRVYDRATFDNAKLLKDRVEGMIQEHMPVGFPAGRALKFRPDLKFRELEDGFEVYTQYMTRRFHNHPYLRDLGKLILKGTKTPAEVASILEFYMAPADLVQQAIDLVFENGVLDEGPSHRGR